MKLVIQIPCLNEEETLAATLADLPDAIPGITSIQVLVIDDGSTDRTAEIARQYGASVVRHPVNKGLAAAFMTGITTALAMGADIIVNTDADNQYKGSCIPSLVKPVVEGKAEVVIGARPIAEIEHFSFLKKLLQKLGSAVVRRASGTNVPDAPSGFRAYSRDAALRLNVFSNYTYTLETIIQCGRKNLCIVSVPVLVNPPTRPSRLMRSIPSYIYKSGTTIARILLLYKSFRFLALVGSFLFLAGLALGIRFLLYYMGGTGEGHVQSLILAAILMIIGFQIFLAGILADLVAANRKLLEEIQYMQRSSSFNSHENRTDRP